MDRGYDHRLDRGCWGRQHSPEALMTLLKPSLVQIGEVDHKLYLLYSDGKLWARELDDNWEEQILPNVKSKIVQFCADRWIGSQLTARLIVRLANGAVWTRFADTDWRRQVLPK